MQDFNWKLYTSLYPDITNFNEKEAIKHYAKHGKQENRICSIPEDFDAATYLKLNPDIVIGGFNTPELAYKHWHYHGKNENRQLTKPCSQPIQHNKLNLDSPTSTIAPPDGSSIGILLTMYYEDQVYEIINYLNRIPYRTSVYISTPNNSNFNTMKKYLPNHDLQQTPFVNYGMDIGNFINQIQYLQDNKIKHHKFLKIHTKRDPRWRRLMFESLLPIATSEYNMLFDLLKEQHYISPGLYTYPTYCSRANQDINIKRLKSCGHNHKEVYPDIVEISENFSPESYIKYNYDLKNSWKFTKNNLDADQVKQYAIHHYNKVSTNKSLEKHRISREIKNVDNNFYFSAGTMFWFDESYLNSFLEKTEPLKELQKSLSKEVGVLVNTRTTVTHSLEYWFGIVAGLINNKQLKTARRVNFLIPPLMTDSIMSGGFRTLIRHIKHLQDLKYIVTLQICWCDENTLREQRDNLAKFNLIKNTNDIKIYNESETCMADIHIATGWQTFNKCREYESGRHNTCFFCQDLEYNFEITKGLPQQDQDKIADFYKQTRPTYTMSRFLEQKLSTLNKSKTKSTRLTVDRKNYYIKNEKEKREGICMLYSSCKKHRLPEITLNVARKISKTYPDTPIYLFGDTDDLKHIELPKNIQDLGSLNINQLNQLYNKCKIGSCFSTTNPSRIGFEMISSGCVCIEIDCEYTKFDLDPNSFVLCEPNDADIYKNIVSILENDERYHQLYDKILNYEHQQGSEEQIFSKFIEDTFYA